MKISVGSPGIVSGRDATEEIDRGQAYEGRHEQKHDEPANKSRCFCLEKRQ
ncbi:MAG: hypothetical protein MR301_07675 [Prevotella sp.]|nr:hypothetical protein [Prevotella sp.]